MTAWVTSLLQWFDAQQRDMPWRAEASPYRTWISEIMLQQTQVDTVIPYFNRFIDAFPDPQTLADADEQSVLKLWEGLGYYSRARNLQKAARMLLDEFGGELPEDYDELQRLPGVGPYVAAAITSIAFGHPVPVVDGNVLRVFSRFWGIEDDIRQSKVKTALFERLKPFIRKAPPADFNQGIMELGALVCRPKNPDCESCPIRRNCVARKESRVSELPFKSKKKAVPHYDIAVGVIWKKNKMLIGRRKSDQMLGGLWEFPGGKQEQGESLEKTVARECKEETGLTVTVTDAYCTVKHAYSHFKITLTAFRCEFVSGRATPKSTDELKWITLDQLDDFPFPTANKKVIEAIKVTEDR